MSEHYAKFLYVFVKETCTDNKHHNVDTELRIVYWNDGGFVIYGKRPRNKHGRDFVPYRLQCSTISQVIQLVETVVCIQNDMSIELHQFEGICDCSKDEYEVEWYNTCEDDSTELVAFDIKRSNVRFKCELKNVLKVIMNQSVV